MPGTESTANSADELSDGPGFDWSSKCDWELPADVSIALLPEGDGELSHSDTLESLEH